jgi:proteasome lid subunit RPN8/RPN11
MQVHLTRELLDAIAAHARAAVPMECCGLLLGRFQADAAIIENTVRARNVHPDPRTRFDIDPQALIDAHRSARAGGPQVIGYYHSHPGGVAEPSDTDIAMAAPDGLIWAIAGGSAGDDAIRFWRSGEGGFTALSRCIDTR